MREKNQIGLYYEPIESLVVLAVHGDTKLTAFLETTGVRTLEEVLAKVVVCRKKLYMNRGWLTHPKYERVPGYGPAFIRLVNKILAARINPRCSLKKVPHID